MPTNIDNFTLPVQENGWFFYVIAVLLLIIFAIIALFMYNFSMNCRRVAYFRGYLKFLEERLNILLNKNINLYDTMIVPERFSRLTINSGGPFFMFVFLVALYAAGIIFVIHIIHLAEIIPSPTGVPSNFWGWYIVFAVITVFSSGACSGICVVHLVRNGPEIEKVYNLCKEEAKSNIIGAAKRERVK